MKLPTVSFITLLFIICKLVGFITWPWVWVLLPVWIYCLLCGVMLIMALILMIRIIIEG